MYKNYLKRLFDFLAALFGLILLSPIFIIVMIGLYFANQGKPFFFQERDKRGVYNVVPGITGLAQINEIDMSTPKKLAIKDAEMLQSLTITDYFKYIFATVGGKGQGDRVVK